MWRKDFRAESFERPIVLRTPEGTWRLYVSCATPDSKHWWIEAIDADRPEDFGTGRRTVVLPGSDTVAVKDPVIVVDDQGGWHAWICEHPLTEAGAEDRMSTAYHRSADGLVWERRGTVLAPRAGAWDARGARVSDVVGLDPLVVLYDGRPRAEDNWHETTGVARAITPSDPGSVLVPDEGEPAAVGALRRRLPLRHVRRHAGRDAALLPGGRAPRRCPRPGDRHRPGRLSPVQTASAPEARRLPNVLPSR